MSVRSAAIDRVRLVDPGVAALVAAMAIWGATYLVTKSALASFGPFTIMLARFVLAGIVLYPFARRLGFRARMILDRRFVIFGLTGMVIHLGLENLGLRYTTAASASLIIATAPAVTLAASMIALRERPGPIQLSGVGLSVVGAGVIAASGASLGDGPRLLGDLLVFGGVVAWAVYTIQGKRLAGNEPTLVATTAATIAAAFLSVPIVAGELWLEGLPRVDGGGLIAIAYLGIGASAGAYGLWNFSLRHVGASVAGSFVNLVPVIGVALAVIVGETIAAGQWLGGAIVALGIVLTHRGGRRSRLQARRQKGDAEPVRPPAA